MKTRIPFLMVCLLLVLGSGLARAQSITYRQIAQDTIINADVWSNEPEILSAGYGFDGIIGVDGGEADVRAAGGTWNTVNCADGSEPPRSAYTSSSTTQNVNAAFDAGASHADGLPVVFSYPILPSTLNHTDFLVTLNTGEVVVPDAASIFPNFEYNERHVAVIFADFGNRGLPGEDGARYPVRVEVVDDGTPLLLLGRDGLVSAVGLYKASSSTPYQPDAGPYLVGAKLNWLSADGEGGPRFLSGTLPNDGRALYGDAAQYRLRVFTSGGFSPDGVQGVHPDEFARFFRLHAQGADGETVLISEPNVDYAAAGGTIRVLGLADLGTKQDAYDGCYVEDHDNYIDIILSGDEAAARSITAVEIPASGAYAPFYNPGGPGNNPTPNVRYTTAGPADLEPVIMALDDPMTVSYSPE